MRYGCYEWVLPFFLHVPVHFKKFNDMQIIMWERPNEPSGEILYRETERESVNGIHGFADRLKCAKCRTNTNGTWYPTIHTLCTIRNAKSSIVRCFQLSEFPSTPHASIYTECSSLVIAHTRVWCVCVCVGIRSIALPRRYFSLSDFFFSIFCLLLSMCCVYYLSSWRTNSKPFGKNIHDNFGCFAWDHHVYEWPPRSLTPLYTSVRYGKSRTTTKKIVKMEMNTKMGRTRASARDKCMEMYLFCKRMSVCRQENECLFCSL